MVQPRQHASLTNYKMILTSQKPSVSNKTPLPRKLADSENLATACDVGTGRLQKKRAILVLYISYGFSIGTFEYFSVIFKDNCKTEISVVTVQMVTKQITPSPTLL